jgi:NitT/TauT family transport system permease protein
MLVDISTGRTGISVWPYLWITIESSVAGTTIGLVLGALFGLIFSNSPRVAEVVRPFIVLANSVPRIALIPLFVLLLGTTVEASIVNVVAIVFFLAFFNAFEGGCSIPTPMLENAIILGAGPIEIMRFIRLPMVLTWTFATVPNAISFGVIVAVTTDLLSGIPGMGALLLSATLNVQSALTFAIIIVLSLLGLILYSGATLLRNRVIRW